MDLAGAYSALDRGDVLIAFDVATTVATEHPGDLEAHYVATLALARSGSSERAADYAETLSHQIEGRTDASVRLREDVAALGARIAKDRALRETGDDRRRLAEEAARRYEVVADTYEGFYACINAASMYLVAGDRERSRTLATRAREGVRRNRHESYWSVATEAEAALLLDDLDGASAALARAASLPDATLAARAATRRQLVVVCGEKGIDLRLLDLLHLPGVVHYCGHVVGGADGPTRFPPELEPEIRATVDAHLAERSVDIAFGSLASGADIVIAEAILSRGGELNVVLPFSADEFEQISVRPGGEDWVRRFRRCLERASSVLQACDSAYLGDDTLFEYASRIAMGHARNRADVLAIEPEQLAIWDGLPARGIGGTARDITMWRASGGTVHVVPVPAGPAPSTTIAPSASTGLAERSVQTILFADFRGFSRLRDEHYRAALETLYEPLAGVLRSHGSSVRWLNSWGDAIQVVIDDVVHAGRCALELQEASVAIDRAAALLPADLDLRIGLHAGPVLALRDPFRDAMGWWGREITRAARIEPRTPEGEVYATDAFAALLALEPGSGLESEYVGRVTTAKDFETIPMYRIHRA